MTNEELNTALYHKMFAEQERFKAYLLTVSPHEVLQQAYEYVCREDVLLALENNDLSSKQAMALMKSDTPLADVFQKWEEWETGHMDDVWACVESKANAVLRADFVASRQEGR